MVTMVLAASFDLHLEYISAKLIVKRFKINVFNILEFFKKIWTTKQYSLVEQDQLEVNLQCGKVNLDILFFRGPLETLIAQSLYHWSNNYYNWVFYDILRNK